ncbi:MAG: glutathione S-transferase [Robiginitomaculum sp.]|nr:MAG: glutathione S-transferase [Robiginitomaculum sp.]
MYTVIGAPYTRTMRVLWCLEELGLSYKLNAAYPQSDDIKSVNPSGKVPALLDGDDVIIDSVAICQHLADKHNAMTFPAGSIERAHMQSWLYFANDEVEAPLWTWWKHAKVRPPEEQVADVLPICEKEFHRAMKIFEARLGDNEFVMGDTFSVPDIILTHCANWAQTGCEFTMRKGKVSAYFERMRSRPAYKKAMAVKA